MVFSVIELLHNHLNIIIQRIRLKNFRHEMDWKLEQYEKLMNITAYFLELCPLPQASHYEL